MDTTQRKQLLRYGGTGLEMGISVLVGAFGGRYLAQTFDSRAWLYIGIAFGFAAGGMSVLKMVRIYQRELAAEEADQA